VLKIEPRALSMLGKSLFLSYTPSPGVFFVPQVPHTWSPRLHGSVLLLT
jgi:hypothetical protein